MPLLTTLTGLEDTAQISMAEVGEPTQYGYAERLMRTIKEEEVDLSDHEVNKSVRNLHYQGASIRISW